MSARRLVLLGIAALATVASPARAATSGEAAAQKLAEKYVPIAMLREQTDPPCKTSEEQYQPTSVDAVLGNPTVTLTHELPDGQLEAVKRAPTAAYIAGLRDGYYLDYEGKVLGNTCVYARAFRKLVEEGKAPATSPASRTMTASPSSTGSSGTSTSSTTSTRATGRGCSSASTPTWSPTRSAKNPPK